jgi:hypothetical protein
MKVGFTERHARFLVHVLVFSGVFLERQYRAFTGLVHGQKTHEFLTALVGDGYATAITPGALHRGRFYHVHYKPLYEVIGEPNNRHRRPASLGRVVERLMLLDAILSDHRSVTRVSNRWDNQRARGVASDKRPTRSHKQRLSSRRRSAAVCALYSAPPPI